jgi:hypothetical protein
MPAQSVRFPDLRYFVSQRHDAFLKGILRDYSGERNWGVPICLMTPRKVVAILLLR